ncbi:MAG: ferrous iron transport protein A [Chthoniobacterales bacterium]|nr:ferrous iron transport protein A [Chthoniobacterales bacterium]
MKQPLSELQPGDQATVLELPLAEQSANRLREMGLLPGTEITFIRRAPLGDPLEIRLRGYHLSLRAVEAKEIFVEKKPKREA